MKRKAFFLFLLLLCLVVCSEAFAKDNSAIVAKANASMRAGTHDKALTLYNEALLADPDSAVINFNAGTAWFKKGDYEKAIGLFEKALLSDDKRLEAKANYNIGNAKYKLGKRKEHSDLQSAARLLRQSLDYYKKAIELNNKDKKAKLNHEVVEKELKTLLDKLQQENKKSGQGQKQEGQGSTEQKTGTEERQGQESQEQKQEEGKPQEAEGQKKEEGQGAEKRQALKQEEAKEKDGKERAPFEEDTAPSDPGEPAPEAQETQEMSSEEAAMLLEGFRQEENAQGHLQYMREGQLRAPEKDW